MTAKARLGLAVLGLLLATLVGSCKTRPDVQATQPEPAPTIKVGEETEPRIEVEPRRALIDEAVSIQLAGFAPGQNVTLRAHMRFDAQRIWESHATFVADENGSVDVGAQRPITGTYTKTDAMGLFWSMSPREDKDATFSGDWDRRAPLVVNFSAEVDSETVAATQIERLFVAPQVTSVLVREDGLVGTLFLPGEGGPYPALIVLGGSEGGLPGGWAALLASHGYAALALAYFGIDPLPDGLAEIPLEYFETAIHWLQSQDAVDGDRLAVLGGSKGGELALLLGATYPQIKAVVGYVPSGVIWPGFDRSGASPAAWTYRGKPLLYVPSSTPLDYSAYEARQRLNGAPIAWTPRFVASLENASPSLVEKATIPVENINGPILLVSGQDDQLWPSTTLAELAIERLKRHNFPYPYEHLSYKGAGHGISAPYWPTTITDQVHPFNGEFLAHGGNAEDNAFACADSWARVLEFLEQSLIHAGL